MSRIEMQACAPAANRYRSWRVEAGQDLFGLWTARITFGRFGCKGRSLSKLFPTSPESPWEGGKVPPSQVGRKIARLQPLAVRCTMEDG